MPDMSVLKSNTSQYGRTPCILFRARTKFVIEAEAESKLIQFARLREAFDYVHSASPFFSQKEMKTKQPMAGFRSPLPVTTFPCTRRLAART